jgi:hypothetical protein
VCLEPTDTGLGFRGEAEFIVAAVNVLGVPEMQAGRTVCEALGTTYPNVPDGVLEAGLRVCSDCVEKANESFPEPVFSRPVVTFEGAGVPTLTQRT